MEVADSELVDLIYAAMLGERPWEDFLDRLATTSPGGIALLFAMCAGSETGPVSLLRGRGEDARADWDAHFASINPYVPGCMRKRLGLGVEGDRLLCRERLVRTEFYNDFMRGNDLAAAVGIAVDRLPVSTILISTTTRDHDEAESAGLAAQYTRLAPHLQRVAAFYKPNTHLKLVTELGGSLFEAVDVGVVLVSRQRRLRATSATAEALLEGQLSFDRRGLVSLANEEAQAALKVMCSRSYDGPATIEVAGAGARLSLIRIVHGGVLGLFDEGGIVILARRSAVDAARARDGLRRTYRLTASEMRALKGIADGRSPAEIAAAAGLSVETIRSQTKALFQKTGVSSRVGVMRLLAGYDAGA